MITPEDRDVLVTDEVERVAITISKWRNGQYYSSVQWDSLGDETKEAYRSQAKASIQALRPSERVGGWMPIEIAPKDEWCLILQKNASIPAVAILILGDEDDGIFNGKLVWTNLNGGYYDAPTHWMPLPAAPPTTQGAIYEWG